MRLTAIILLLWAGMVLGISLEAWVKFKTPGLNKEMALKVGRTVFNAFHRAQWLLWCLLIVALVIHYPYIHAWFVAVLALILVMQTLWLFPRLSASSVKRYHHQCYACLELIKFLLLLGGGCYFIESVKLIQ